MVNMLKSGQKGAAVALSLDGRAREAAMELDVGELNSDTGLDQFIEKLDGLFLKDENQRIYRAYSEFEKFQRPHNMNIEPYINDFEHLYNKVKFYKIELRDCVLAYRLLESANLSAEKAG